MLKNVTLSAEEQLIEKAREKARRGHRTLNLLFRDWLEQYVGDRMRAAEYRALMKKLSHVRTGRKFTRDELNERR